MLATTTPDQTVPATSSSVHYKLGCRGAAFDLNAACAGFVYGLVTAVALLDAGHDRALVVGSDTLSQITDQSDRSTAVIFADGAGAVVVEATEGEPLILAHDLGLDGSLTPILYCDKGGFIMMEGREVFRKAVRATVESARRVLKQADVTVDEIALLVPHQANLRIIDAVGQRLGIDPSALCDLPRPHRQHLGCVLRDRARRGRRGWAPQGWGPRLVLRLRSGDDLGERRRAMGWGPVDSDKCRWARSARVTNEQDEASAALAALGDEAPGGDF